MERRRQLRSPRGHLFNYMALAWYHAAVAPTVLDVAPALNSLIQRCMAKEPDQRPQSFAEVRQELSSVYFQITGQTPPEVVLGPPPAPVALNDRACCLLNLGLLQEARELFLEALQMDPAYQAAWTNLGGTLRRLGHYRDSVIGLERALQLGQDAAGAGAGSRLFFRLEQPGYFSRQPGPFGCRAWIISARLNASHLVGPRCTLGPAKFRGQPGAQSP